MVSEINSSGRSAKGYPLQLISHDEEEGKFTLNEEALEELLLQDHVKDKHIAVISVAGAFRKGKSFLLDFFLRYLDSKGSSDWMGPDDTPLKGFSWRGGSDRDTSGILAWSQVFTVTLPNGEEIAVILLDTQGAYDTQTTVKECATIFALSTMVSSVQVYNLSQNIQEDDLQHLQLFTEYGKLALEDTGDTPFQRLLFLVRDWSFPYEEKFGHEGGKRLLSRRLQVSEKQHHELQSLRHHIQSCFQQIDGFLMPHPGLKVATNPDFDGRLSDIEPEFKDQLKILAPLLLSSNKILVKEISGRRITAKELTYLFKSYMTIYQGETLPEPKSMLLATAEANNLAAMDVARETYSDLMEGVCGGDKPYMNTASLEEEHRKCLERAVDCFNNTKKMGGPEFSNAYEKKLHQDLEELYAKYQSHNENKNIFKAARTPSVLFVIVVFCHFVSGIMALIGITIISSVLDLIMAVALMALVAWTYVRYSGDYREFGTQIDELADLIWEMALRPVYKSYVQGGLHHVAKEGLKHAVENGKSKHS